MKRLFAMLTVTMLLCGPVRAADILKMSLDDATTLGTRIEADPEVKAEGKGSVRVTTRHATTVCLGEVTGLMVEEARLIYRARVKSELDGEAFLEMWAFVGTGQYYSRGLKAPIRGKSDWTVLETPFVFQKGQNPGKIILNLVINGTGTVWVDDVVLAKLPLD